MKKKTTKLAQEFTLTQKLLTELAEKSRYSVPREEFVTRLREQINCYKSTDPQWTPISKADTEQIYNAFVNLISEILLKDGGSVRIGDLCTLLMRPRKGYQTSLITKKSADKIEKQEAVIRPHMILSVRKPLSFPVDRNGNTLDETEAVVKIKDGKTHVSNSSGAAGHI